MSSSSMANQTGMRLFLHRKIEINFQEERIYITKLKKNGELGPDDENGPRPAIA